MFIDTLLSPERSKLLPFDQDEEEEEDGNIMETMRDNPISIRLCDETGAPHYVSSFSEAVTVVFNSSERRLMTENPTFSHA